MKLADYEQKKELAVFDKDFYAPPSARMRDGGEPTEAFDVKACVCFLRRAIRKAAEKYHMKETDATRIALENGICSLFQFPYVEDLNAIWNEVSDIPGGDRYLDSLESGSFNFKDDRKARLNRRVKSQTLASCGGFSKMVGLNLSDVIQLALMAGLLKAKEIPAHYREMMFDHLQRFLAWLQDRFERAKQIKKWAMEDAKKKKKGTILN